MLKYTSISFKGRKWIVKDRKRFFKSFNFLFVVIFNCVSISPKYCWWVSQFYYIIVKHKTFRTSELSKQKYVGISSAGPSTENKPGQFFRPTIFDSFMTQYFFTGKYANYCNFKHFTTSKDFNWDRVTRFVRLTNLRRSIIVFLKPMTWVLKLKYI